MKSFIELRITNYELRIFKTLNIKYLILFLSILLFFTNCNETYTYDDDECNYYNCDPIEPFDAILYIGYTKNEQNPALEIIIMQGKFETQQILDTIRTEDSTSTQIEILMPINQYYTVMAKYIDGQDTIIAIDGDMIEKDSYYECDSLCWKFNNGKINVKLNN